MGRGPTGSAVRRPRCFAALLALPALLVPVLLQPAPRRALVRQQTTAAAAIVVTLCVGDEGAVLRPEPVTGRCPQGTMPVSFPVRSDRGAPRAGRTCGTGR